MSESVERLVYISEKMTETMQQLRRVRVDLGKQAARIIDQQPDKMRRVVCIADGRNVLAEFRLAQLRYESRPDSFSQMSHHRILEFKRLS